METRVEITVNGSAPRAYRSFRFALCEEKALVECLDAPYRVTPYSHDARRPVERRIEVEAAPSMAEEPEKLAAELLRKRVAPLLNDPPVYAPRVEPLSLSRGTEEELRSAVRLALHAGWSSMRPAPGAVAIASLWASHLGQDPWFAGVLAETPGGREPLPQPVWLAGVMRALITAHGPRGGRLDTDSPYPVRLSELGPSALEIRVEAEGPTAHERLRARQLLAEELGRSYHPDDVRRLLEGSAEGSAAGSAAGSAEGPNRRRRRRN